MNIWTRICDFGGGSRAQGMSLAIDKDNDGFNEAGFVGLGKDGGSHKDFWQLTVYAPNAKYSYFEDSLYTITYTDSSQHAESITWLFGDGNTSTDPNPTHTFSDTLDSVTTCLVASNPCTADTSCKSIRLCPPETQAQFFYKTEGLTVEFIDSSSHSNSWWWSFGDGDYNFSQNPTHSYSEEGTYEVCLRTENKCTKDTICDSITVTSTGTETLLQGELQFYPNPAQEQLHINMGATSNVHKIELITISGKVIKKLDNNSGKESITIDISSIPSGLYYLKIQSNSVTLTRKVMVTNE
jgi:PKD repeat protein